jgi:hypothetical protein
MKTLRFTSDGAGARRAHTATIVGKHLIVHGGITPKGVYLDDLVHFDLTTLKWSGSDISDHNNYEKGVAFHKCCPVFDSSKK